MRPSDHVQHDGPRSLGSCDVLPRDDGYERNFGQPPIQAFQCPNFFIEVLFWMDATTAIHQHRFSGAFHVLDGSSIHTEYAFEQKRRYNDRLLVGDLAVKSVEYLEKGSVRPIRNGNGTIHALFHLDRPSISVVVRTGSSPLAGPQYSYVHPGIAYDPFYSNQSLFLRTRTIEVLRRSEHAEWKQVATQAVRNADSFEAFLLLRSLMVLIHEKAEYESLLDEILPAHADLIAIAHSP